MKKEQLTHVHIIINIMRINFMVFPCLRGTIRILSHEYFLKTQCNWQDFFHLLIFFSWQENKDKNNQKEHSRFVSLFIYLLGFLLSTWWPYSDVDPKIMKTDKLRTKMHWTELKRVSNKTPILQLLPNFNRENEKMITWKFYLSPTTYEWLQYHFFPDID